MVQGNDKFYRDTRNEIYYWPHFDQYDRPDNSSIHVKDVRHLVLRVTVLVLEVQSVRKLRLFDG